MCYIWNAHREQNSSASIIPFTFEIISVKIHVYSQGLECNSLITMSVIGLDIILWATKNFTAKLML